MKINTLSAKKRELVLQSLQQKEFDLVIIGGGVTGAGIALDAASRGLTVALVEKEDFAAGTSSRSTKLIHGGLRYLKQLEISLVREVGMERAVVHKLAPHLVIPEKMLLPLVEGGTYGKLSTSLGLMVYDFLAKVEDEDKRLMLSKERTLELEPLLKKDIVVGSGFYAEYRTDDARLTIELIKTAAAYGAISINYVKAEDLLYGKEGMVCGIKATNQKSGKQLEIKAKYVVSAAGPWVDTIRKVNRSLSGKHLFLSKGVHIVVPHEKFPVQNSVYFDIPDGRMIFAIPRGRVTYVGPTDTPYKGDLNHVLTNQEDVDYILEGANAMFPSLQLKSEDVESSWAGLRPLIFEEGKSASELSRRDEIFESETGLISIAGGKLTGYRKMAERIVNLVVKKYRHKYRKSFEECQTESIILTGGPFKDVDEVNRTKKAIAARLQNWGLEYYYADYLVSNYGRQSTQILENMQHFDDQPSIALARAELAYGVENELVSSLMDFYARRTGRLYFHINSIAETLPGILHDFTEQFNWDHSTLEQEKQALNQAVREASTFEYSETPETT